MAGDPKGKQALDIISSAVEAAKHRGLEKGPEWEPCGACRQEAAEFVLAVKKIGYDINLTRRGSDSGNT